MFFKKNSKSKNIWAGEGKFLFDLNTEKHGIVNAYVSLASNGYAQRICSSIYF